MVEIAALLIGLLIAAGGLYYLMKEKADQEARKIYGITLIAGVVITSTAAVKMFWL